MKPGYTDLYEDILVFGRETPSRMGMTKELLGSTVCFAPGEMVSRKGINDALGFMELMQILGGVFDPGALKRVAPNADHSLFTQQMAYGPRLGPQMPRIVETLRKIPETRQAVVFIGNPVDGPTNYLPCTLTMQFVVRNDELTTITTMRSWDITRGLAYDVMFQGGVALAVARCLGISAVRCICTAGSLHLYEDQARKVPSAKTRRFEYEPWIPKEWKDISAWAEDQINRFVKIPAGIRVTEE